MNNILNALQTLTANEAAGNETVFVKRYLNGKDVLNLIHGFKSFHDTNNELLIYAENGTYSASTLELFDVIFITHLYGKNGCIYELKADYDVLYDYAERLHNSK